MKKQKPKKWGNREQRDEWRVWLKEMNYLKKPTNKPKTENLDHQWPRVKPGASGYCSAKHFARAGYPGVALFGSVEWSEVHSWCKKTFKMYTWTGSIFWFQSLEDSKKFIEQFPESKQVVVDKTTESV
jgi:hypothetical protein